MKQAAKYISVFIAGAIFATAGSSYAATVYKSVKADLRPDLKVSVNGKALDTQPLSYNGSTYLPLRKAAEAVGGQVSINGSTISIVTSGTSTGNTGTVTDSVGSTDVWYNFEELSKYNILHNESSVSSGVEGNLVVVRYNGNKYPAIDNVDCYYDSSNDKTYYTKTFFLKFLSQTILDNLKSYKIDTKAKVVTQI